MCIVLRKIFFLAFVAVGQGRSAPQRCVVHSCLAIGQLKCGRGGGGGHTM